MKDDITRNEGLQSKLKASKWFDIIWTWTRNK